MADYDGYLSTCYAPFEAEPSEGDVESIPVGQLMHSAAEG